MKGMTDQTKSRAPSLPHHRLVAYQVAVEFLLAVNAAGIQDAKLRDEAVRAAKGACLNVAEGAGRYSRADKARAFAIARGEAVEAVAAVEIAACSGDVAAEAAERCAVIAGRLIALLSGLIRR
jgi:four helix bundle protein